jgi:hypothetical protein
LFLADADSYRRGALRTSLIEHQDGITERWQIQLEKGFSVFVDCSTPSPWSSSNQRDFYSSVVLVGYDAGDDNFFLP